MSAYLCQCVEGMHHLLQRRQLCCIQHVGFVQEQKVGPPACADQLLRPRNSASSPSPMSMNRRCALELFYKKIHDGTQSSAFAQVGSTDDRHA